MVSAILDTTVYGPSHFKLFWIPGRTSREQHDVRAQPEVHWGAECRRERTLFQPGGFSLQYILGNVTNTCQQNLVVVKIEQIWLTLYTKIQMHLLSYSIDDSAMRLPWEQSHIQSIHNPRSSSGSVQKMTRIWTKWTICQDKIFHRTWDVT